MKTTRKCFLIDDDPDDQEIFLIALEQIDENIKCTVANNGIDGIQKLSEDVSFLPDYIFIDVNMPKKNGIECLPEIKKLQHLKDVKIIMYSTSSDARIINMSKELGAHDFLVKPSGMELLIKTLTKILEK